ncbi:MAG TPA: tetratricopeptide repeat protein [Gammaproteobacteria bacterium]|nr:tetratricopeptide repeat protein [Gammaproteobacteria bacterium]
MLFMPGIPLRRQTPADECNGWDGSRDGRRNGNLGRCLAACFLLILGAMMSMGAQAQSDDTYFNSGLQAANKGNYSQALEYFRKAQKAGLNTPALKYNLAVSYFKLGQYERARTLFMSLTDVRTFEQLAYFNLGLIANKQEDKEAAIRWFQRAYRDVSSQKIRLLAKEALRRLGVSPRKIHHVDPVWRGFVSSSLAYDSNVTLLNNDILGVTNQSDTAVDVSAVAGRWLKGNIVNGVRISLGANLLMYSKLSQNDYSQLNLRVMRYDRLGDWKVRIGGSWDEVYFNGSEYQRVVSADVRTRKDLSADRQLRLRYKLSRIQATDAVFDYLDGWRQQFRVGMRYQSDARRTRYYYQLDVNDRKDRIGTVDPFTSYSPTRHTLRATGWWGLSHKWQTRLDARYRYSRYNDPNELAGGISLRREDNQLRLSARISRKFVRRWEVSGQYSYTNNDSNMDRRSYDRSVAKLSVSWSYY